MRFLARLVAGQLATVALLVLAGVRWPATAATWAAGLQSFAVAAVVIVAVVVGWWAILIVRSQRQPPYLEGRDHA